MASYTFGGELKESDIWLPWSTIVILQLTYFYFVTLINLCLYTNNYVHIES
jgi:hypothetical protein